MNTIPKTITGTATAYLMSGIYGPDDLTKGDERAMKVLNFFNFDPGSSYTKVGTATVVVDLLTQDEMLGNQIDVLKDQKRRLMADTEKELTNIDSKIQQLLAITMTEAA